MTLLERAASLRERLEVAGASSLVVELVDLVSALIPVEEAPSLPPVLMPGREYELVLRVRAQVLQTEDGAYYLKLDQRMFGGDRHVAVDADEVVEAADR